MFVATPFQSAGRPLGQPGRSIVFPRGFQKRQRTVIGDEVIPEERVGRAEFFPEQSPEPAAAHFGTGASEPLDRAAGMFSSGPVHS